MKVHNIPSLNPLQLFRSPFQGPQQQPSRPGLRPEQRGPIPKVPSLLFELELEEAPVRADLPDDAETQGILTNFRTLAVPWSKTEHELLAEWKATADAKQEGSTTKPDSMDTLNALASSLRNRGYPVSIRTALGGGWGGECLRNLRHSFLVCTVPGEKGSAVYIIDPAFREQFDIAHATPRYEQILAAIPPTFVGTEERLVALVRALCQEIQGVFMQQNATLPPWRDVAAQLSKWRPRHSMDRPISPKDPPARPSHDLNLVRTFSSNASNLPAVEESGQTCDSKHLSSFARASAPIPLAVRASAGGQGDPTGKASSGGGPSSMGSKASGLYQRVAVPMQQLVTRSYTQPSLLVSGL